MNIEIHDDARNSFACTTSAQSSRVRCDPRLDQISALRTAGWPVGAPWRLMP